jgi:hypothetical protein
LYSKQQGQQRQHKQQTTKNPTATAINIGKKPEMLKEINNNQNSACKIKPYIHEIHAY